MVTPSAFRSILLESSEKAGAAMNATINVRRTGVQDEGFKNDSLPF
jgi:hypothetical protein